MKKLVMLVGIVALAANTFAQQTMTPELLWKLGRVSLLDISPDQKTALYNVRNYSVENNNSSAILYAANVKTGATTAFTTNIGEAKYLFDGKTIGGVIDDNYVLADAAGENIMPITNIKDADNFKTVALNDGRLLLLFTVPFKFKESLADAYPELQKANAMVIDDLMYRHWNYWNDEFVNHLCFAIYDPQTKEVVSNFKDIQGTEIYETPNPWNSGSEAYDASTDGKYIVYSSKKSVGKVYAQSTNTDLYLYEIASGITTNITNGMMGYDITPAFSTDAKKIAFLSMPTAGYESDVNQLWVYDLASNTKKEILGEEYVDAFSWVSNTQIAYQFPTQATQQLGVANLKGSTWNKRTITSGDFNYGNFVMKGSTLLAHRTDYNHAVEIYNINLKNGAATQFTKVNDGVYNNLKMSKVEKRMVKTSDGKEMLTWVIYPPDFDANKQYPTLLYCQGGPQSPVSQFYSFRWNFQLMAAKGYIIVAPNRRGVQGFGKEWNEQISGDWGGQAIKDYLIAIDDVAKEPYVNPDKLGAVGASYGGYSVYMLAGVHEGRFKALVAHCGLFNLDSWYGTTEELFFANHDIGGPYWDPKYKAAYEKNSPHKYVQNWTAPLLVIHCGKDFRVPINQGMEAFQAAQLRNVPSKFLYFPEEGHWVLGPQNGIIWHTEYFAWLDKWLK